MLALLLEGSGCCSYGSPPAPAAALCLTAAGAALSPAVLGGSALGSGVLAGAAWCVPVSPGVPSKGLTLGVPEQLALNLQLTVLRSMGPEPQIRIPGCRQCCLPED